MNEVGKGSGGMKRVFKCRTLGMMAKRILVPATLYGAETWNMGAEERRRQYDGDEASEEYVRSNTNRSSEEWRSAKENEGCKRVG